MRSLKSFSKDGAYALLDLCTGYRGIGQRIGGEVFRFPAKWSRYYEAGYEAPTFQFLKEHCRPGSTALDLGAHLGLFTMLMARRVGPAGKVYAFEPTPF